MRKVAYAAAGLIIVLIGLVLALPSFIDLNDYKAEIVDQVAAATGRELTLDGDIDLSILPAPTLSVAGISLSNIEGASQPELAKLNALEVRVALWPLLSGQVQVERITLVDPVIWLEVLPSGQQNWLFEVPSEDGARSGIGAGEDAGTGLNFRFDRIDIENGRVNIRDVAHELDETISSINAQVSAGSFDGPFDLSGSLAVRNIEIRLDASVGRLNSAAPIPIKISATVEEPKVSARFSGNLSTGTAQSTGLIEIEADNVAGLLAAFDPKRSQTFTTSSAMLQPFKAKAQVSASPGGVEINDVELQLGSATANGAVNVLFGDATRFDVALSVSRLQLEEWLPPAGRDEQVDQGSAARTSGTDDSDEVAVFELPVGISGSVTLGIEALTYREGVVSQVDVSADMSEGTVTISRASALLPGGSSFDIQGNVRPVEGLPQFEGQIQAQADNFRGLLDWLGIVVEDVPSDRLRKLGFTSTVRATPKLVQVYGVDMRLDSSRLSGGLAYAFRARPAFSVDFVIDQLNVDAYLPPTDAVRQERSAPAAGEAPSQEEASQAPLIPPQVASVLEGIDTNTKVTVKALTLNDASVKGLEVDIGLLGGELTVRKVSIESLAGGSFAFSGNARDLSSKPNLNAKLEMAASNVAGLARLAGVNLPVLPDRLGPVKISGQLNGRAEKLALDLSVAAVGGTLGLKGTIDVLAPRPRLDLALALKNKSVANIIQLFGPQSRDGNAAGSRGIDANGTLMGSLDNLSVDISTRVGDAEVSIAGNVIVSDALSYNVAVSAQHPDAARFVNEFGIDYRPAAVNLGNLRLAADVSGTASTAEITDLKGSFGPASLAGMVSLQFDAPRPRVTGNLNASEIILDLFLPRSDTSSSQGGRGGGSQRQAASRWSSNAIDISFLRSADVALEISARGIIFGAYTFTEPKLSLSVRDGILNIDPLTGKLFAGDVELRGRLQDSEIPSIGLAVNLSGADLQRAIVETVGIDSVAGEVKMEGNVSAQGRSERELVSALNGTASFAAQQGVVTGIDLKSLSDRLKRLNEIPDYLALLQTTLSQGQTRFTSLGGTVGIEKGVLRSTDLGGELEGARLSGQATVDLPRWLIDLESELRLTEHPQAPPLGVRVRGSLDAPQRDVKSQDIERYLAQRIGGRLLQKILPKEAKGIGSLLLGGQGEAQGSSTSPGSSQDRSSQKQQPEPLTPESLLKGLFKGFGK